MVRPSILRILIRREFKRLQKNPSALAMLGLLTAIAFVMALSGGDLVKPTPEDMGTIGVVFDKETEFTEHLRSLVPSDQDVRFDVRDNISDDNGNLFSPKGWTIVELQNENEDSTYTRVDVHFTGASRETIQPFLKWFRTALGVTKGTQEWVDMTIVRRSDETQGEAGIAGATVANLLNAELLGTALVLMVQFFCSCHLLVSFTAEDREQGTLNALALTTATLAEIMIAKGIFHLTLTMLGCTAITSILAPAVLFNPVFWVTILLGSISAMCVGTCIATLAKNQAAAGMLALCYIMAGAILFFLANQIPALNGLIVLAVETYSFSLLYCAFKNPGLVIFLRLLIPMSVLTMAWIFAARHCFYRFGWK